jgi:hypothetical protein
MNESEPRGRIVIIPFLHGKLTTDGKLSEPDIYFILEKWLERHPEFRGREKEFRVVSGTMHLPGGHRTDLVRVTAEFSPDLAGYDSAQDADLYEYFLADSRGENPARPCDIWIDQCEAARGIEDEFGTQQALDYLVGEKFLNFLEAAETDADFRAEVPAFVAEIKSIFERWQLAEYLERARETEPFDPGLFEPTQHSLLGEEEIEFDAEEIEEMRKDDIRQCTRDLLLVERAKEWLLEDSDA